MEKECYGVMVVDCEEGLRMEEEEEERGSEMVRWEEYLPRMVIRVLLVEADDSTRQIIAALLRKCNYKVAAIPDGLKAWEILKQKHSNIDLILTEVDLPSISGYALLTLIMEHDSCKNIPVIMMSSSDSISMIFKCMLKGAADFLIKPVRRNELKNLWQHVWRRISANNASGVQNLCSGDCKPETSSKSRDTENCLDDNVSSSKDKSQSTVKASDSQAEKIQGHSRMKPQGALKLSHNEVHSHEKGIRIEGETEKGKSTRSEPSTIAHACEVYALTSRLEEVGSSSGIMSAAQKIEPASCRNIDSMLSDKHIEQAIDLIGTINNQLECTRQESTSNCEMHNSNATELELSLRRLNDPEEEKRDGKQRLKQSHASAFSRYSSSKKLRTLFPSLVNSPTEAPEVHVVVPKPANTSRMDKENKRDIMSVPATEAVPIFAGPLVPAPVYGAIYPPLFSTSLHSDPGSLGDSGFDETSNHEQRHTDGAAAAASHCSNSAFCSNGFVAVLHSDDTLRTCKAEQVHVSGNTMTSEQFARAKGGLHNNSQREAALAKFRQKRKDRCFEKKVRYQSRKKLAEQRPRVKGQFVRHQPDTPHQDNG